MCGIFGYYTFGTPKELQTILDVLFTGLKRLEYRGYDSAGLCIDTSEAPGRVSTDGSRFASLDGSTTNSPFAGNGTPGAALEAAIAAEGKCPDGAEPVIIKCPGKIANLEKMTEQYVKDHVSCVLCCSNKTASTAGCCICKLPYEPSLARALGAHERAVRRGPDPV
jgi:asparagine synthetase B (glutamine-hydrolysing)